MATDSKAAVLSQDQVSISAAVRWSSASPLGRVQAEGFMEEVGSACVRACARLKLTCISEAGGHFICETFPQMIYT